MVELGVEKGLFVGGAEGALARAAGGAAAYVLEEGGGGPGVVLFGEADAAFAQMERDGFVGHGFGGGGHLNDRVGQHLLQFATRGAGHNGAILAPGRERWHGGDVGLLWWGEGVFLEWGGKFGCGWKGNPPFPMRLERMGHPGLGFGDL